MNRAFVTGATGFIGSALVEFLLQKQKKVYGLVHQSPLTKEATNLKTVRGDLMNFDWQQLEIYNPGIIFHFARIPGTTKVKRQQSALENARANERLLKWMQYQKKPPLLVFGSGTLVYGDHKDDWVDESTAINPISFQREYFEAERPILKALKHSNLPIIIVRLPWVYGNGSWFNWFFAKHMQDKGTVPQYGNGQNYMSLVHLDDCAGIIDHISENGTSGKIYNLTRHPPVRQQQFVAELQELTKLPIKKYSNIRLWLQFDKAAREALTFSLKCTSTHQSLLSQYEYKYPNLRSGLQSLLQAKQL